MKAQLLYQLLRNPWLYSALLILVAIFQLTYFTYMSVIGQDAGPFTLTPADSFLIITIGVGLATTTPELSGLRILQLPICILLVLQIPGFLLHYFSSGLSTIKILSELISTSPMVAIPAGLVGIWQLTRKYNSIMF